MPEADYDRVREKVTAEVAAANAEPADAMAEIERLRDMIRSLAAERDDFRKALKRIRELEASPGWLTPSEVQSKVLAIIDGAEEAFSAICTGCGTQYADEESGACRFTTRERMTKLMRADGWQVEPPLCPACQPAGGADRG
jgi:hypothetical protein